MGNNDIGAKEIICANCGSSFIYRCGTAEFQVNRNRVPRYCYACSKTYRLMRQSELEIRESQVWQQQKEKEHQFFLQEISKWNLVPFDQVCPSSERVLYIIGNGFDLMHLVKSSYYAFRDSLGRKSTLRYMLESFLLADDIWADFENALATFNMKVMSSPDIIDMWLDSFDAYDEEAGAAEFYMAVEACANPICSVYEELQERLRAWVDKLTVGTEDLPLRHMFRNGKVLNFNYTEFVETLYNVPHDHVCYIHGCRRRVKGKPKEKLIIGHKPGASDSFLEVDYKHYERRNKSFRGAMINAAQDAVIDVVANADEELTKRCANIIASHQGFFKELKDIKEIIVIGHSLSPVDWEYFEEVAASVSDKHAVHWYFGCHGIRDLKNLEKLLVRLEIQRESVEIFRTDLISVVPAPIVKAKTDKAPKAKMLSAVSTGVKWCARTQDRELEIITLTDGRVCYKTNFPTLIDNLFFARDGVHLFVVLHGLKPGVFLFACEDSEWKFIDELMDPSGQGLLNRRLNRVFVGNLEITFVYNNRFRVYSLNDGKLVVNQAVRDAKNTVKVFGDDVSRYFIRGRKD